jgi:hypothetical protein
MVATSPFSTTHTAGPSRGSSLQGRKTHWRRRRQKGPCRSSLRRAWKRRGRNTFSPWSSVATRSPGRWMAVACRPQRTRPPAPGCSRFQLAGYPGSGLRRRARPAARQASRLSPKPVWAAPCARAAPIAHTRRSVSMAMTFPRRYLTTTDCGYRRMTSFMSASRGFPNSIRSSASGRLRRMI